MKTLLRKLVDFVRREWFLLITIVVIAVIIVVFYGR